jgi:hypothetical protein
MLIRSQRYLLKIQQYSLRLHRERNDQIDSIGGGKTRHDTEEVLWFVEKENGTI